MTTRNALVDLSALSLVDAEIISYLDPKAEGIPELIAVQPDPFDPHDDSTIDTTKWSAKGSVGEGSFLGVNGLTFTGPATPTYDSDGVIYKPPITHAVGKMVLARAIMEHPIDFLFVLQEYDYTVDSVVTPTTWTLKHLVWPQDLRNTMGIRVAPGALYFFEGGAGGNEEFLVSFPARRSQSGDINPIQVAFIFTETGWDIYAHLPGIWDAPQLIKQYTRPGGSHNANGYSFCVNKYSSHERLHFYNLCNNFKSNAQVNGGRILTANEEDQVVISSLDLINAIGYNMGKTGTVNVRIPDYSPALLTLEEVAQVTEKLTGKQVYPIEFELNGDAALKHPVRITIEDATLPEEASVEGE